jgi:hypothetical protein
VTSRSFLDASRELRPICDQKTAIDLGTHNPTVGCWMIEATPQCSGKKLPGVLELGDLFVKSVEAPSSNRLPLGNGCCMQDPVDLIQGQAGVLQQADEDKPAEGLCSITALSRPSLVRKKETASLVVPDSGRRHLCPVGDVADGQ